MAIQQSWENLHVCWKGLFDRALFRLNITRLASETWLLHLVTVNKLTSYDSLVHILLSFKAYFSLGHFRATRNENKKIGWRKKSPRASRNRSYFFVCSCEQIRQVENRLNIILYILVRACIVVQLFFNTQNSYMDTWIPNFNTTFIYELLAYNPLDYTFGLQPVKATNIKHFSQSY